MKYALINLRGEIVKRDLEWDGKTRDREGLFAKVGSGDYYNIAELWPERIAEDVARHLSTAQALIKQAEDNHAKIFYDLRNKLIRGEL